MVTVSMSRGSLSLKSAAAAAVKIITPPDNLKHKSKLYEAFQDDNLSCS